MSTTCLIIDQVCHQYLHDFRVSLGVLRNEFCVEELFYGTYVGGV